MERAPQFEGSPAEPWHAIPAAAVLERLDGDGELGLTTQEAQQRQQRYGLNRLPPPSRRPAWLRFLLQFHNVLIYLMLAGAVVTAVLGHWTDTGVLLAAVLVNAVIGFIQEGKAEQALDAIRGMLSPHAVALRDGVRLELAAEQLVPGDIVLLASGDRVPADLRLIGGKHPLLDEAILTGESMAVQKTVAPVAENAALGDRLCMLYSGTMVASGQARGVVVATGVRTELGRIGTLLSGVDEVTTPLLRQMNAFSRWLALVIVLLALATFALGVVWRGHAAGDMMLMVVALTASAIPEGLPAILTITLALGVRWMAAHHAIIRNLPAVEALGAVTIICTDKTGTLTRNEMTVQRVVLRQQVIDVDGIGYAPVGALESGGRPLAAAAVPILQQAARAATLCNDAVLEQRDGAWHMQGDPTEGALQTFACKCGLDPAAERAAWQRTDLIPFESELRFMATLNHDRDGHGSIFVKGAPERVLEMCASEADGQPLDADYWRRGATDCAALGLRLLALAGKPALAGKAELEACDVEGGFALLALVGLIDPPRPEAVAAVATCSRAGIRVKMITGDHADTARAIGAQMGIGRGRPALSGAEIELMDDDELREVAPEIDVFARASPEHKLRLVQALQGRGHVVSMTGDGVNDAPALKRADIGVAMGMKGTEAAKEAADMVLADDNFATIGKAVHVGRGIYDNIQKFVLFMLPTNGGEGLIVVTAILFDLVLPLTATQVLWINMVTSATLGLALALEQPEPDVMERPPRDPRAPLLSWLFVWRVSLVSLLMMGGGLGLFLWEMEHGASLERARTMAVCAVVVAEMFYLLNSRHIYRSVLSVEGLFGNPYVLYALLACLLLQLAFVYFGPLQRVFLTTPLALAEWGRIILVGVILFFVIEIEKSVLGRLHHRTAPAGAHTPVP